MKHLLLYLAAVAAVAAAATLPSPGKRWWQHIEFLADDRREGRNTGSKGYDEAAHYVMEQFLRGGLKPMGTKGFFQSVNFRTRRILEDRSRLVLVIGGAEEALKFGDQAIVSARIDPPEHIDAPLVFVGYGLRVPEINHDDLLGDLRGKVLVYLTGMPAGTPGPLGAHYSSQVERWKAFEAAGATGAIALPNPRTSDVPWARAARSRGATAMDLRNGLKRRMLSLTVNPDHAERLFSGSGHRFADLLAKADKSEPLPRITLAGSLRAEIAIDRGGISSDNVVGLRPGSDPRLKDEYVVVTAHLDHIGRSAPVNGDPINNGAMDNASGVASLIEIGSALRSRGLRRSVLFVAVTAEEKGLLGSRYFAENPTVPADAMVANINFDMFLPLFPLKSLVAFGVDESDLGDLLRQVAAGDGVAVQSDPEPLRNRFIRSDQYSFIRRGIPALAFKLGYEKGSPEEETARRWTRERYHAPSDDLSQPVDLDAAARFNELMAKLVEAVANRNDRPRWKDTSYFRLLP